ncbi:hypothetical protein nbrc107696_05840 [Gordonia spumicola]|uniref:DUF2339 domain-containing protein n=1 Tax=Gordonia spumicola TaxID=589161 RepID=A0A7I9V3Y3_9ACTN|nr:DUF2339 domain-containing protein [Gordonia spumicola]GEE00138.1 hypothetical protein nbrc107696_05840 [Gordonia spumicola]
MNQTPQFQPHVQYQTNTYTPYPLPPLPPRKTLGQRLSAAAESGLIGRILAGVGVAITLSGMVMLLVLAAQAGLLRPEVRVAGGGVLAAALAALGIWIGRAPAKRPGAVALVATGIAGLLFDVLATSTIYHWIPVPAALAATGAIAGVGLTVAHRWDSQTLGLMVSIPVFILSAIVNGGIDDTLVAFLIVYVAASTWIQVGRGWTPMFLVNTAAVVLPAIVYGAYPADPWIAASLALAGAAVIVGSSVLLARTNAYPELIALVAGAAALPLIFAVSELGAPAAAMLAAGAAIYGAAAFGTVRVAARDVRVMWLLPSAVLLMLATGYAVDTAYQPSSMLAASVVLAGASYAARDLAFVVRILATVFGVIGVLMLNGYGAAAQVFSPELDSRSTYASLVMGTVLGLIAVGLITWSWATAYRKDALPITMGGAIMSLWLVTTGSLSVAHLVTSDADAAFRSGHAAATIIWGAVAVIALLVARRLAGSDRAVVLTAGLAVMAAAIGKLFLFDLATLDGVYRVIAFMVVGLMLLGLGVSYAQTLTTSDDELAHTS